MYNQYKFLGYNTDIDKKPKSYFFLKTFNDLINSFGIMVFNRLNVEKTVSSTSIN